MKSIDLVILKEKIANYPVYSAYKKIQKSYFEEGMDLSYDETLADVIEEIATPYSKLKLETTEMPNARIDKDELDTIAKKEISGLFKEYSHILFRTLLKNKVIDADSLVSLSNLSKSEVTLTKYDTYEDLIDAIYHITQVIMYEADKRLVYLDLFPQAFKLIAARKLEKKYGGFNCIKNIAVDQLESLNYNIYLSLLYPSLTPIFMPYSVGLYLANEIFLQFQEDCEKFVYYLNEIFKRNMSIEDYLKMSDINMSLDNIDKIYKHHQMIIK